MKSITLGSLFDGSGGFPLAGTHAGITPVWAAEIEPYPIAVSSLHFPQMKHLGDVSQIDGKTITPVDIITFGSPCFPSGTLINTAEGLKPIECVSIDDKVLTHTGMYRQVINSRCTGNKNLLKLKAMGIDEIEATENHRFFIRTKTRIWDNARRVYKRIFSQPQWRELKDIRRGDYLCIPIIQTEENPLGLTHEDCWLIGRYIADGYTRNKQRPNGSTFNTVIFCIGKEKQSIFENHLITYKAGKTCEKNIIRYSIYSNHLVRLCELCGKGAENKTIPQTLLNLPIELLTSVIEGYMSGDGCYTHGRYKAITVSAKLAYSLGAAITKAYHTPYCLYYTDTPKTTIIEGRIVNQKPLWQITFKKNICKQDKAFYKDNCIWVPVNNVIDTGRKEAVYDLTVTEDHSFCVKNIAVHNCQDMSIAGKREGIKHKDKGDDETTRSGLFYEAIRIIKEMRETTHGKYPKYAVWENVYGAFSSNKGEDFRCVLEEFTRICDEKSSIPRPADGKWRNAGEIVGDNFSIAWRLFDAQYWGVPQRRKRIYLVANFTGRYAGKILFERESMRGNSAKGGAAGQDATEDATKGAGRSRGIQCLNPWDAQTQRLYNPDGVFATLRANSGGGGQRIGLVLSQNSFNNADYNKIYALQGNSIDRADTAGCNGCGWREDVCYTLNTIDRPALCFKSGQGSSARSLGISNTTSPSLVVDAGENTAPAVCYDTRGNGNGTLCSTLTGDHQNRITDYTAIIVSENPTPPREYIIRRLTPLECCRLQGFPDGWGDLPEKENMTDEEFAFWQAVRDTYARINSKATKSYTSSALLKWYNKLHTDSAEYKMWGNGIALPCAKFIMEGIAELCKED